MKDTVCVVTGANAGIGKETARGLAARGATVVLVGRNEDRGRAARDELRAGTGNDRVDLLTADLGVQAQVRRLAADLLTRYDRLDVLVHNAGVFMGRRTETPDGIETTFAVNHLAPFLLTRLLLDRLKASAPARVVVVASRAHRAAGRRTFDDPNAERSYDAYRVYARSKLANILFTYELARRLEGTGVTANGLHPGVVATRLADNNRSLYAAVFRLFSAFYQSPEKGAETPLYLATDPAVAGINGRYFDDKKAARSSAVSYDTDLARRLWDLSAALIDPDAA